MIHRRKHSHIITTLWIHQFWMTVYNNDCMKMEIFLFVLNGKTHLLPPTATASQQLLSIRSVLWGFPSFGATLMTQFYQTTTFCFFHNAGLKSHTWSVGHTDTVRTDTTSTKEDVFSSAFVFVSYQDFVNITGQTNTKLGERIKYESGKTLLLVVCGCMRSIEWYYSLQSEGCCGNDAIGAMLVTELFKAATWEIILCNCFV